MEIFEKYREYSKVNDNKYIELDLASEILAEALPNSLYADKNDGQILLKNKDYTLSIGEVNHFRKKYNEKFGLVEPLLEGSDETLLVRFRELEDEISEQSKKGN